MRVLFVSLFPLDESQVIGGVEGVTRNLIGALMQDPGISVKVIVPYAERYGVKASSTFNSSNLEVHTICSRGDSVFRSRNMKRDIAHKANSIDFDIAHVQNDPSWTFCVGERPCVFTVHGINELDTKFRGSLFGGTVRSHAYRLFMARHRRSVRHVIAINPYVMQFLDGKRQKIWLIDNPVDDSFFEMKWLPHPGRIFSAGTILRRKNQLSLLKSVAMVRDRGLKVELRVAGSGLESEYGKECLRFVRENHLEDSVVFLGQLSPHEIANELSRSSCFALPSLQETAPLAISEAMAVGVPVVASKLCGIPYMVEDKKTGILVDPSDTLSVADGIQWILMQTARDSLFRSSKEHAEMHYRASVVAEKTKAVYRQILKLGAGSL